MSMGFFGKKFKKVAKAATGAMGDKSGSVGMLAMAKKPGKFSGVAGALSKAMAEKAQQGRESMPARSKGMGPIGKLMQARATKTPMFKKGGAVAKKTGKGKAMGVATRGGGRALMKGK